MCATRERTAELPLGHVLLVVVLVQIVLTGIRPTVSYRAISLGAGSVELGLISASFALLSVIAAIPIGKAIDRHGAKRFIIAACAVTVLTTVLLAFTDSIPVVIVTQAVIGLALVTAAIGFQTLIANGGPAGTSEARFGVFTAVVSLGQLLGPGIAGVIAEGSAALGLLGPDDPYGTVPVFLVISGCAALATVLAIRVRELRPHGIPARQAGDTAVRDVAGVLRARSMPSAMFASLVILCTIDLLGIYLPLYGAAQGLSIGVVSALLATRAAASLAVRLFMGRLLARMGRKAMLALGGLLGAVSLALMPFLGHPIALFVIMAVLGIVLGTGQPLTMAWVARTAPAGLRSTALATRLTANRLGQFVIPIGAGLVAGAAGTATMFFALGGLLGLTSIFVLRSSMDDTAGPEAVEGAEPR